MGLNWWQEKSIEHDVEISVLNSSVSANITSISTLNDNVESNFNSISANNTAISSLQASVSANTTAISTLNTDLATIANKLFNDFFASSSAQVPWTGTALASGTLGSSTGNVLHTGVVTYTSSTSANSGYRFVFAANALTLGGEEKTTIVFKTAADLLTITRYMGFMDATGIADLADGVYAKIVDGVLSGETSNNSTVSVTATTFTLSASTWYRLKIELNSDASLATYTLYVDDSDIVLWTDTLSTNIPIARQSGHGDLCFSTGTTAILIGFLDYMDIFLPNRRKV
jgi:hypothetical protein